MESGGLQVVFNVGNWI